MGLLDALAVLLLALALDMLLFWLSGHFGLVNPFADVPADIRGFVEGAKGLVVAGGATVAGVLIGVLRRWARGSSDRNYLVLVAITAAVILVVVIGLGKVVMQPPESPITLRLHFGLRPAATAISYIQKEPQSEGNHYLAPGPDGRYDEPIPMPGKGLRFLALINPRVEGSEHSDTARRDGMRICLQPNGTPPRAPPAVELECSYPEGCGRVDADPGWLDLCKDATGMGGFGRLLIGQALAGEGTASGWRVPSLETLKGQRERGYTAFDLSLAPAAALKEADAMTYAVRVNDTPVYFDGWAPEELRLRYDPTKPFEFQFGLENLNFSGADKGREHLNIKLTFWRGEKAIQDVLFEQPYVALRDMPQQQITQSGLLLDWQGTYVKARQDERFEVMLLSTPSVPKAEAAKRRFDGLSTKLAGRPVVGVLRPPLHSTSYGVAVGVERPSGQIDFTFEEARAKEVCALVLDLLKEPAGAAAIDPAPFRYEVVRQDFKPCRQIQ